MEIPRVIIPRGAGVGSAIGLLVADKKVDVAMTRVMRMNEAKPAAIKEIFTVLEANVTKEARKMDPTGDLLLQRSASMRYVGQGYELRIDLPSGNFGADYADHALAAFHAAYQREYGYSDPKTPVEATDWFAVATAPSSSSGAGIFLQDRVAGGEPVVGHRQAYFPEAAGMTSTKVVNRYALSEGHRIVGPALVEERESTIVVLPGDVVYVSKVGNLIIEIKAADTGSGV
jgi:N-methylhydantoinase A